MTINWLDTAKCFLHTGGVTGSIPVAPTTNTLITKKFYEGCVD